MAAPPPPPFPDLRAWLETTSLADALASARARAPTPPSPAPTPIAAVESDEPVAALLTLLASRRVLSAPVCIRSSGDPPGSAALARGGPPAKAVAGFASAADVLDAVLSELGGGEGGVGGGPDPTPDAIERAAAAVCARPVGSLLDAEHAPGATVGSVREATAGRDWALLAPAPAAVPLLDAIAFHFFRAGPDWAAGRPRRPVHRLALVDGPSSTVAGIASQSDVVAALAAAPPGAWGGAAEAAPLDRLLPAPRPIVSLPAGPRTTALAAFRAMRAAGVPGIALTDPDSGALVGHLSASDARCLAPGTFGSLALPVATFLAERPLLAAAATDTAGGAGGVAAAVAAAAAAGTSLVGVPGATRAGRLMSAVPGLGLRAAAAALAAGRVHQLYEVDPATGAPVRVVAVSDVLAAVLAAAGGAPA